MYTYGPTMRIEWTRCCVELQAFVCLTAMFSLDIYSEATEKKNSVEYYDQANSRLRTISNCKMILCSTRNDKLHPTLNRVFRFSVQHAYSFSTHEADESSHYSLLGWINIVQYTTTRSTYTANIVCVHVVAITDIVPYIHRQAVWWHRQCDHISRLGFTTINSLK